MISRLRWISIAVLIMQDLRAYGKLKGWCPYFLARHMVQLANVVVYSYQYLLDPKVAGIISKEMQRESVVVFDEAHNIDNVCIEALSVSVRMQTLEGATRNINRMSQEIDRYVQVRVKCPLPFYLSMFFPYIHELSSSLYFRRSEQSNPFCLYF